MTIVAKYKCRNCYTEFVMIPPQPYDPMKDHRYVAWNMVAKGQLHAVHHCTSTVSGVADLQCVKEA